MIRTLMMAWDVISTVDTTMHVIKEIRKQTPKFTPEERELIWNGASKTEILERRNKLCQTKNE